MRFTCRRGEWSRAFVGAAVGSGEGGRLTLPTANCLTNPHLLLASRVQLAHSTLADDFQAPNVLAGAPLKSEVRRFNGRVGHSVQTRVTRPFLALSFHQNHHSLHRQAGAGAGPR